MISAVVLTKNEEENLPRCLKSLVWCDEILVIDDESFDKTVEIAQKYKAQVFTRRLNGDFTGQRNYALNQAKGEWLFFVDADEEVSQELQTEIKEKIAQPTGFSGFSVKRQDFFLNRWLTYGETSKVKLLRLAKKGMGEWERAVDEVWRIKGKIGTLKSPLFHYSHPLLAGFLESINQRSTLNARFFYDNGVKITYIEWPKPFLKFIHNYFLRFGFLDGVPGLLMAALMSFHSFLVRGKLFLLWKKEGGCVEKVPTDEDY